MPLEIRELTIRASVNDLVQGSTPTRELTDRSLDQTALISACVEQVLAILKEQAER
ncbi:MAG: DUF5908 family protein [Leptolyngbyaceae cyanobacterium MO_188.B28]|nr:DUF5908 family protein [Leptolyngbyaceae cyanobacterium MO_188.B28]